MWWSIRNKDTATDPHKHSRSGSMRENKHFTFTYNQWYISPELFILQYIKHSLIAIHSSTANSKRIWDIAMTANRSIITLIGIDFILNSVSNWKSTRYWFSYCCLIYEIKGTVLDVGDVQTTPNFSSGYCLDWPISLLLAKYVLPYLARKSLIGQSR